MISKSCYSSLGIVSFFDVTFESSMNKIMERVLEGQSEVLISSLVPESHSSNDASISSVGIWNKSCSVEESGPNFIDSEVFFDSSFFHGPANNFNDLIRLVSDFNKVHSITVPVVALGHIGFVEVVLSVVVMSEIVCRVNESASHLDNYITDLEYFIAFISSKKSQLQ